jgi:hypothetical protein
MRTERFHMGSRLVLQGHKPMSQVELGRVAGRRSQAHDAEGVARLVKQPPDQCGGDAATPCACP